jgi:hypothetical protein
MTSITSRPHMRLSTSPPRTRTRSGGRMTNLPEAPIESGPRYCYYNRVDG